VLAECKQNGSATSKRQRTSLSINHDFDQLLVRWISDSNNRRIGLSGPLIQEKARKLASELGISDFKASNGWLDKFRKRTNIVYKTFSGERGDVNQTIVDNWKERLPSLCEGYAPCDIFNMDETGLFYKQGKLKSFCVSGTDLAGGKRAKDRITVALCASMTGEKLKPLVIGKSRNPRCFSRINVDSLPVTYTFNKKSWMNSHLYEEWLSGVNKQMRCQKRNILIFVDNAPSHPHVTLSNVMVVFLPPNTTSVIQPMDQGIIQTMKLKFYQQQSQRIIREMDNTSLSGSELLKKITVLDTIYWISRAWNSVDTSTIIKCFNKCGFDKVRQTPPRETDDDSDDDAVPILELVRRYAEEIYGTDIRKVINADIPTCDNNEVDWDASATAILDSITEVDSDSETEEVEVTDEAKVICTVEEASDFLKKVQDFACDKGNTNLLNVMMEASAVLSEMVFASKTKQTQISDFLRLKDVMLKSFRSTVFTCYILIIFEQ